LTGTTVAARKDRRPRSFFFAPASRGRRRADWIGRELGAVGMLNVQYAVKAPVSAGFRVPERGRVFVSVANRHKRECVFPAKALREMGYDLVSTRGTAKVLRSYGVPVEEVPKVGARESTIIDLIDTGEIVLVVNTPVGRKSVEDERAIRPAGGRPCPSSRPRRRDRRPIVLRLGADARRYIMERAGRSMTAAAGAATSR
jgi:hypothetical protein